MSFISPNNYLTAGRLFNMRYWKPDTRQFHGHVHFYSGLWYQYVVPYHKRYCNVTVDFGERVLYNYCDNLAIIMSKMIWCLSYKFGDSIWKTDRVIVLTNSAHPNYIRNNYEYFDP